MKGVNGWRYEQRPDKDITNLSYDKQMYRLYMCYGIRKNRSDVWFPTALDTNLSSAAPKDCI